jgi:hypothetical protein
MGAGAFLVYSAVKGTHPWTAFLTVLGGKTPTTGSSSAAATALGKAAAAPTPGTANNPLAGGGNL